MNIKEIDVKVFPGRLLIEREVMPFSDVLVSSKGEQRRKNKGKVIRSTTPGYKNGDDVFFAARRGTLLGDKALIDINDVILHNMKLIGDRILVEPIEEKKVTDAGIIVPDTIQILPQRGYVRVIGDGVPEGKFKEGDELLFRKDAGIVVEDKVRKALILSTRDIYAIVGNEKD